MDYHALSPRRKPTSCRAAASAAAACGTALVLVCAMIRVGRANGDLTLAPRVDSSRETAYGAAVNAIPHQIGQFPRGLASRTQCGAMGAPPTRPPNKKRGTKKKRGTTKKTDPPKFKDERVYRGEGLDGKRPRIFLEDEDFSVLRRMQVNKWMGYACVCSCLCADMCVCLCLCA